MFRKGLIACLALLCLFGAALAEDSIPYFSDVSGIYPVSEDRSDKGRVLQTYEEVGTGDCAAFSVTLLESGFTLSDKALTETGAVRMTYDRADTRILTEYENGTLRVSCPDVRRDDIALAQTGDLVSFGNYAGESVEWLVLEERDNCLLLVSQYALEAKPYNDTYENTSWENCSLRAWLNDAFLQETFTEWEAQKLLPDESGDKVSLLSAAYAENVSAAVPTPHALENGCNVWENGCCWYFLKDAGYTATSASCVRQDGKVFYEDVSSADMGVRAVILYQKRL